jgi:sugar O-acyltransferase (sialic acid O-acetyltransferase NeuD family)
MKNRIVIIGAGGHGKVMLDAILSQGIYDVIGFADDGLECGKEVVKNYKIIANSNDFEKLKEFADSFIVAIGNNSIRERIYNNLKIALTPAVIIHAKAMVAGDVDMRAGVAILANAVVSSQCVIGENAIINAGVIVDHECKIGSHAHLSVGTIVGCNSALPDCHKTNLGEIILPFSVVK